MTDSLTLWMTAIGSIATAVAAIVALVTFIAALRQRQAEILRETANSIRKNLFTIVQESEGLYDVLRSGNPLLIGAHEVAAEYGQRLGPSATPEDFWRYLGKDDQLMLSVSVNGWHRAKQTDMVDESVRRLKNSSTSFRGNLSVIRYAIELLDRIINDAYSPMIFVTILQKASDIAMRQYRAETSLPALVNSLSNELMSSSAGYFAARYYNSIRLIKEFIESMSYSISDLDDAEIVSVTKDKTREIERMPYITDKMRTLLEKMEGPLTDEAFKELTTLIDKIEHSISKESAASELTSLYKRKKDLEA